jgi:hypothetical protein
VWSRHQLHSECAFGRGQLEYCLVDLINFVRLFACTPSTQDLVSGGSAEHFESLFSLAFFNLIQLTYIGPFHCDWGNYLCVDQYSGCTPLHLATCRGRMEVCQWLVDHGADVNIMVGEYIVLFFFFRQKHN